MAKNFCCNSHTSSTKSVRQRRRFAVLIRILLILSVITLLGQCGSFFVSWQRQNDAIVIVNATATTAPTESSTASGTLTAQPVVNIDAADNTNNHRGDTFSSSPPPPPPRYDFLLNVPFYVYDNDLLWINKTSFGDDHNTKELHEWIETVGAYKHSDDYWFAHAALHQHPQRTHDPAQAKLFVVPLLLNTIMARIQHFKTIPFCIKHVGCEKRSILRHMNRVLQESTWFQRHGGRDHIVIASHYHADYFMLSQFFPSLLKCNMITFEGSTKLVQEQQNVVVLPSMYVGRACPMQQTKTDDIVMVGSLTGPSLVHFKQRREMCQWLKQQQQPQQDVDNTTSTTSTTTTSAAARLFRISTCGEGEQCPALANARFGMHVRGDTFGANRLLDTLLSGTVPIFTWPQQYDILPNWIDWKALSYFANVSNGKASFLADIDAILADDNGYQQKHELVLRNRDLFDWKTPIPFDVYMYILSVRLWSFLDPDNVVGRPQSPNKKKVTSRYTALILP